MTFFQRTRLIISQYKDCKLIPVYIYYNPTLSFSFGFRCYKSQLITDFEEINSESVRRSGIEALLPLLIRFIRWYNFR